MLVKDELKGFLSETRVTYPLTRKKIEKAGWTVKDYMLEMRKRILRADDIKDKMNSVTEDFLKACEDLMADE